MRPGAPYAWGIGYIGSDNEHSLPAAVTRETLVTELPPSKRIPKDASVYKYVFDYLISRLDITIV
jgi:hypothetical protein